MSIFESFLSNSTNTVQNYETNQLNDICFPVATVPLFWNQNNINDLAPEEFKDAGHMGVLDVNNNNILYAGKEYSIIKNHEIIEVLETLDGFNVTRVRNFNNTKFQIDLENRSITSTIKVRDNEYDVHARVRINNSYDGSLAFGMQIGCYIQICSNGAILGDALNIKRKHVNLDIAHIQEQIESGVLAISDVTLGKHISKLNKYWDTPDDKLESMFKGIIRGIPDPKNGLHPLKSQLMSQCTVENSKYHNGAFALFMAVTNMTTFPSQYNIAPSYLMQLERNTMEVFK